MRRCNEGNYIIIINDITGERTVGSILTNPKNRKLPTEGNQIPDTTVPQINININR